MTIGILKEPGNETRVSLLPQAVATLTQKNIIVFVEKNAGEKAFSGNAEYENAGAQVTTAEEILRSADIVLSIHHPSLSFFRHPSSIIFIGFYQPLYHIELMKEWATKGITTFSLDMLPRTTRAQAMDVLSSQANIAGYKAVLVAANLFSRYFPMLMTAAGSVAPAKVLILGAGVAGLQAIATARRLGAIVEVLDTRPAVKEEVMSLGAKFIEVEGAADASKAGGYAVEQTEEFMKRQKTIITESIARADIIITTAQVPGKKAPILISEAMITTMRSGSVIIDLASGTGGNTELTKNNETIVYKGVSIVGASNLPATMPSDASKMYGKNILNFLKLILDKDARLNLNWEDDLVQGSCITHNGAIIQERLK